MEECYFSKAPICNFTTTSITPRWVFFTFLNCTNDTNSLKASYLVMFSSLVRGSIGNVEQLPMHVASLFGKSSAAPLLSTVKIYRYELLLNIDVLIPPQSLKDNYDKIRFLVKLRDVERQLN